MAGELCSGGFGIDQIEIQAIAAKGGRHLAVDSRKVQVIGIRGDRGFQFSEQLARGSAARAASVFLRFGGLAALRQPRLERGRGPRDARGDGARCHHEDRGKRARARRPKSRDVFENRPIRAEHTTSPVTGAARWPFCSGRSRQ